MLTLRCRQCEISPTTDGGNTTQKARSVIMQRLHELGFVKSTPQKIIANGTD
jgi:hypothetical protein